MDDLSESFHKVSLENYFIQTRKATVSIVDNLEPEDMVLQSADFVSPIKWHLAHTTWFFEEFIIKPYTKNFKPYNESFSYVFNSYYNTVGEFNPKQKRGLLNRPLLKDVFKYREYVNEKIIDLLLQKKESNFRFLIQLGINHEQQHQELILMDIKNIFYNNPLMPKFINKKKSETNYKAAVNFRLNKQEFFVLGYQGGNFCFDNELPISNNLVEPFQISPLITNKQWYDFIRNDGYKDHKFWLSDGWDFIKTNNIDKPMYWIDNNYQFSLNGIVKINENNPVSHISFYEADAFSRFMKKRLPTEIEIEFFLKKTKKSGNFFENKNFHEIPEDHLESHGNLWVWTQSNYLPYKNYKPYKNKLTEYNSKFMCNQFVLKGGSHSTPKDHVRSSYRNFYYPKDRWHFCGLRLATSI